MASAGQGTGEKKMAELSSCLLRAGTLVTRLRVEGRALVGMCVVTHGKGQEGGQSAAQRGLGVCLNVGTGPRNGPFRK